MNKSIARAVYWLAVVIFTLTPWSIEANSGETITLDPKDKDFQQFYQVALSGDSQAYLRLTTRFKNHPLFPYAKAEYLSRTLDVNKQTVINDFLTKYDGAPFIRNLKAKWHSYLIANNFREAFLSAYELGQSASLDCQLVEWALEEGQSFETFNAILTPIWQTELNFPDSCGQVLSNWIASQPISAELVLERVAYLAKFKKYNELKKLKPSLPDHKRYLIGLWQKVSQRPTAIYSPGFFLLYNQDELNIVKEFSGKLAFANSERFYKWWQGVKPRFVEHNHSSQIIHKNIAIALAVSGSPIALTFIEKLEHDMVDESVKHWKIAAALSTQNWRIVKDALDSLPEWYQVDTSVVFWKAKASLELGYTDYGNRLMSELSERRDYYGFLASSYLGKAIDLRDEPVQSAVELEKRINSHPTFSRAMYFYLQGDGPAARLEWNYLETQLSDDELIVASHLAAKQGWHNRPIFSLSKVDYLNDVNLRFPLAFANVIETQAQQTGLPASLLYAVARRESSFIVDAYSSAGAAGLMQIKPRTASSIARKRISKYQLFQPKTNVKYASQYLSKLLRSTDDHIVLAAAAYNAGFNRVKGWLPKAPMAADIWIETIPYKETRNYVKAVIAYKRVYNQLLQEESQLAADITSLRVEPEI